MRPQNLKTRIFLDSGDPAETKQVLDMLGFLDGQTTNPSLIAKNPAAAGKKFSKQEVLDFYRSIVQQVSQLIPAGSVSIEVSGDSTTTAEDMLAQAKEFFTWIPNAHIKFPTTQEGLKAAEAAVQQGLRVNMTLVFSQQQAAAVYVATIGALKGDVFISPFIGRLDDVGENGMDLIDNILKMYESGDGHVEVLTASVRTLGHLLAAINLGSDIITAPFKVLKEWADAGLSMPDKEFEYHSGNLRPIIYQPLSLEHPWQEYDISHELTDKGVQKFSEDWSKLIK